MKKQSFFALALLAPALCARGQSLVQTVNSGAISSGMSSLSVGEIFDVQANANAVSSGLVGILAQTQAQLEVPQLSLEGATIYPNPTSASIFVHGAANLIGKMVRISDASGKTVMVTIIGSDASVNLESLAAGLYLINIDNNENYTFKIIKHP